MKVVKKIALLLVLPFVLSGCDIKKDPTPTPTNFSVSFNANGGQGRMDKMSTAGSTFVAPRCKFTYEDHTFEKWALNSATGKQYEVGDTISNIKKNITLYAIWSGPETTTFTVSFNANGGTGTMQPQEISSNFYEAPSCSFTYEGHTFSKWALNSPSGTQYGAGTTIPNISSDITLYALWEEDVPAPSQAAEYQEAFNSLKSGVTTGHNYTLTIHSTLEGFEHDPEDIDTVYDDVYVMINNKIFYHNNEYTSLNGRTGVIYQKNQGYINFDYYGNNVLPNGFFSTRTDVGITELDDLVGENLFLGEFTQDPSNVAKFVSTNTDVMAVIANFVWGYPELISNPDEIYYIVNSGKDKATLHSVFTYWTSDGGQDILVSIVSTLEFSLVGSTSEAKLEAYLENPTTTFSTPTSWTAEQEALFATRYAGTHPTFISGSSYTLDVFENLDKNDGKYKILLQDFLSSDKCAAYGNHLVENELFSDYSTSEKILYKRIDVDTDNMTKTTYVVEMWYLSPSDVTSYGVVSRRFPQGIFQAYFYGTIESVDINTIQLLNEYFATKGYTNFVPQFSLSPSTQVSHFSDSTDSKNVTEHKYELYTSTFRIYIPSLSDAKTAMAAYVASIKSSTYGFTSESKSALLKQVIYDNPDRYQAEASIWMMDLDLYTTTTYEGFVEIKYVISAEKGESDIPHVVGLILEGSYKTTFTQGDSFSFGGVLRAQLSDGDTPKLEEDDVVFDQYNLSQNGDQTVRVGYTADDNTFYKYYDIHVESNVNYVNTFRAGGQDCTAKINLCDDNTGTYIFTRGDVTGRIFFTYSISGESITFTLVKCVSPNGFSDFTKFCIVGGQSVGTSRTGTYDAENNQISVELTATTTSTSDGVHVFSL